MEVLIYTLNKGAFVKFIPVLIISLLTFSFAETYRLDFSSNYRPPTNIKSLMGYDYFLPGCVAAEYLCYFGDMVNFQEGSDETITDTLNEWDGILISDSLSVLKNIKKPIVVIVKSKYVKPYR